MSEASRSQVTITLGRTRQVVKRAGGGLDGSFAAPHPVVGNKRSVRERLGNNVDSYAQFNKRFRGDARTSNSLYDIHLSKDDLRHKITKKHFSKQSQNTLQNGVDLRNILSRPASSSKNSTVARQRIPEPKDTGPSYMKVLDAKPQHYINPRDHGNLLPMARNSSQHRVGIMIHDTPDPREQHMRETRESAQRVHRMEDVGRRVPEPSSSSIIASVSGLRAAKPEPNFDPYAPWTLDQLRRRSPDEAVATIGTLSAPRKDEEYQRRFTVSSFNDAKARNMSKDTFDFSRPMTSSSGLTKTAPPVGPVKTVGAPVIPAPLPQPSSLAHRSVYVVDDSVNVDSLLKTLGLERYAILFKAEEVDMYSLKRMTENDLKEMGLPMGPRKKILLALQPRLRRQV